MHQGLLDHIFHERLIRVTAGLETRGESPEQAPSQVRQGLGLDRSARRSRIQLAFSRGARIGIPPHHKPILGLILAWTCIRKQA
jgi:hypothetical protein